MNKIKGFDGIRAICAMMVLYSHSALSETHIPTSEFWRKMYHAGLSGGTGVMIFFVLSGYLISQLLEQEILQTGKINYRNFLIRRVLRLLPVYLFFLVVISTFVFFDLFEIRVIALMAALTYTYNFMPATFGSGYTNHLWSLSVEEQFYLLFPLIMHRFYRRQLILALVIIVLSGLLLINLFANIPLPDYAFTYRGVEENLRDVGLKRIFRISTWLLPAGLYCLVGCIFGLVRLKVNRLFYSKKLWSGVFFLVALLLFYNGVIYNFTYFGVNQIIQCTGVGLGLVYLQFRQDGWVVYVLSLPPLPYLGKISYGTYVWHGLFIGTGPGVCLFWWQGVPFGFLFTYLTAMLSFALLESPFLKLKARYRGTNKHQLY